MWKACRPRSSVLSRGGRSSSSVEDRAIDRYSTARALSSDLRNGEDYLIMEKSNVAATWCCQTYRTVIILGYVKTSGLLLLSLRRVLNAIIVIIMILFSQHFQRNCIPILLLILLLSSLFAFLTSFALRWMDRHLLAPACWLAERSRSSQPLQ
jgi:hypothetical protein